MPRAAPPPALIPVAAPHVVLGDAGPGVWPRPDGRAVWPRAAGGTGGAGDAGAGEQAAGRARVGRVAAAAEAAVEEEEEEEEKEEDVELGLVVGDVIECEDMGRFYAAKVMGEAPHGTAYYAVGSQTRKRPAQLAGGAESARMPGRGTAAAPSLPSPPAAGAVEQTAGEPQEAPSAQTPASPHSLPLQGARHHPGHPACAGNAARPWAARGSQPAMAR